VRNVLYTVCERIAVSPGPSGGRRGGAVPPPAGYRTRAAGGAPGPAAPRHDGDWPAPTRPIASGGRKGEATTPRRFIARARHAVTAFPRQFWLLVAGTALYLVGVQMAYPFESIYLNRRLGVPMTTVGLMLGLSLLAGLPFQVVGGALADRLGRRPVLALAALASAALYAGLGLTGDLRLIVALLVFEAAFGWAQYLIGSNAMIADLVPLARRAEAFSLTRVALNAGTIVGPLLAGWLISRDPTFRLPFVTAGAVCLGFFAVIVTLFRETRPPAAATAAGGLVSSLRGYAEVLRDRRFVLFSLVALLPLYGFGQVWVTTPIVLEHLFAVDARHWGYLVTFYAACTTLLQFPVVRLVRRRDHSRLMAAASLGTGLGLGGAAFVPWPWTVLPFLVLSLGLILLVPIASTIVAELAPAALRGRYMGAWTLVYMGGYALGPLLGGWAMDGLGDRGAFAVVAAAGLAGALLFPTLKPCRDDAAVGDAPGGEDERALRQP